ncbi:SDR family oxidoreductase [Roseomonas sp. NAR14]|uniref:SDR family oxidoreductase n=1 Tax=Roseomonas acroporae TaxID=2937791 RepID=A0A9X1Y963_9PROT|nr:SDR family NAD(P)-dependent oxidoreductase [Roseomonas acroporae]MCK8785380.1 SDR family oxidoreductase [Roseomonas acroporae]
MLSLEGKVAIVTGCGSVAPGWGNGKATSVLFARQGATVYGVDISEDAAAETRRLIEAEGGRCHTARADVTDRAEVEAMVADCVARFGRVDILVNNVGRSEPGDPGVMTEELWDDQIEINLKTAFLCCRAVIPVMLRQGGGAVVSVASTAGIRYTGKPQSAYAAAKAGVIQLSRTAAISYADKGIRFNCVLPGLMHTPLVTKLAEQFAGGDVEGFVNSRHGRVPKGSMGTGWDVAHAVLFLASDEAGYVTGTELVVDGGLTAATR